jgi:hypothetical protein
MSKAVQKEKTKNINIFLHTPKKKAKIYVPPQPLS